MTKPRRSDDGISARTANSARWIGTDTRCPLFAVLLGMREIVPRELAALDRYEGFPRFYGRAVVRVEFRGRTVEAMLYEMTPAAKAARSGISYSEGYRAACSDGARAAGIPDVFDRQK